MAAGLAKGAAARGKRIAFGDGVKVIWDHHSEQIFRGNPNVAPPDYAGPIEWIPFYRGHRMYNTQSADLKRWRWNYDFRAAPGELYFSDDEDRFADSLGNGFIVIEPNVPEFKTVANNKRWPVDRYAKVARYLRKAGYDVRQFANGRHRLDIPELKTRSFRDAARILKNATLYIGPEGGLHHASACVGLPAVVLFGGFIPPAVTGYSFHTNLTGGAEACGSIHNCEHCKEAMEAISVDEVHQAALGYLKVAA